MNANKFVYKGVTFDLNLNEIAVDARVQDAMDAFKAGMDAYAKEEEPVPFTAASYVQLLCNTVNAIFDQDDAAVMLFEGETTISGYAEAFVKIAKTLGEMRGIALKNAASATKAILAKSAKKK